MVNRREAVLPTELKFGAWRILGWEKVRHRAELLALCARQLKFRDEDIEEAVLQKQRKRMEGKEAFDKIH